MLSCNCPATTTTNKLLNSRIESGPDADCQLYRKVWDEPHALLIQAVSVRIVFATYHVYYLYRRT